MPVGGRGWLREGREGEGRWVGNTPVQISPIETSVLLELGRRSERKRRRRRERARGQT